MQRHIGIHQTEVAYEPSPSESADLANIERALAAARRQIWVVTAAIVVFLALGFLFLTSATPLYTAYSQVLIDANNSRIVDQLSVVGGGLENDTSILSQVELLKADEIGLSVVDSLQLVGGGESSATEVVRQAAAEGLSRGLGVTRVGRTLVLQLSYTSPDAQMAATIVNAFAEAYLTDQLDSKYEATRRASGWLQERIADLREQSIASDLAVQRYRAENGLIATGGELITDQQLSQLNAQLIQLQGETAEALASVDSIRQIIASGNLDAVVSDALDMPVITDMRSRYLDASRREADISARLGDDHEQAIRLRGEMSEYRRLMFEELSRIAESYDSRYQVAKAREDALLKQVQDATGVSTTANDSLVQLRELEREAESYRTLYQTFLQRYQEAVQQQSFPITEARIISRATVPTQPSSPKFLTTLATFAGFGMVVGIGVAAFREFRDRFFRTGAQVKAELGQEFLGFLPMVESLSGGSTAISSSGTSRLVNPVNTYAVDHPRSLFAETMRSAKIAVDMVGAKRGPRIVGIVSVMPGEGKSTVAINFARHLARQGTKTLLLDADLRNSSTTRTLTPEAHMGLIEILLDRVPIEDVLFRDPLTGLLFVPSPSRRPVPYASELLASPAFDSFLEKTADYEYILLDLPPLGLVVDARAMASRIDGYLLVAEWGKTPRRLVRNTLDSEWIVREKCTGVILNKVDTTQLALYQSNDASAYNGRKTAYYQEGP